MKCPNRQYDQHIVGSIESCSVCNYYNGTEKTEAELRATLEQWKAHANNLGDLLAKREEEIERLSATPVAPSEPDDDETYSPQDLQRVYDRINEVRWRHDTHNDPSEPVDDRCQVCDTVTPCWTRQKMDEVRDILDFEFVVAPSVGELEWRRLEDLDGKPDVMFVANALHAPFLTWQIARGLSDEWCLFPPNTDWNVEQTVLAVGSSVRGLQSLANSLQRILSGAEE